MIILLLWIVFTFIICIGVAILAQKYGVEYAISLVAVLAVLANIFATKIVVLGPLTVPAGVIVFSLIFFITDLISEKWGIKKARKAVWAGFLANLIFIITLYLVIFWPAAAYAQEFADKFSQVLALTPRIIIASFIAYLISQHHDIWLFAWFKKQTNGKHLWLRNNSSTIISQLIDSVIFIIIAFYGVFPVMPLILGQWTLKILIALLDTPFLYGALFLLRKIK
ncbi:MAG: queuosine precursor transporter [Candidatus Buchananbacteria bacterium]|nr:queuosine precursor transporter [Candidatus Buchananbacteria bacterium]